MEYQFDPYGLTVLPPPNPLWKRTQAFLAGIIANRLSFFAACISAWLPLGKTKNEKRDLDGNWEKYCKAQDLLKIFEKYNSGVGIDGESMGLYREYLDGSLKRTSILCSGNLQDHELLADEIWEVMNSESSQVDYIDRQIRLSELWLAKISHGNLERYSGHDLEAVNCFRLGYACDFLVNSYACKDPGSGVDFALEKKKSGGKKYFSSKKRKSLAGFPLPDFISERVWTSFGGLGIEKQTDAIGKSRLVNKFPDLIEFYSSLKEILEALIERDCVDLSISKRVCFGTGNIVVDGNSYEFDKNGTINESMVYTFVRKGIFGAKKAIRSKEIPAKIQSLISGQRKITASGINPKDRFNKCKAPWAKHFAFRGVPGNHQKKQGVGYFLQLQSPRLTLNIS